MKLCGVVELLCGGAVELLSCVASCGVVCLRGVVLVCMDLYSCVGVLSYVVVELLNCGCVEL